MSSAPSRAPRMRNAYVLVAVGCAVAAALAFDAYTIAAPRTTAGHRAAEVREDDEDDCQTPPDVAWAATRSIVTLAIAGAPEKALLRATVRAAKHHGEIAFFLCAQHDVILS